jgi:hypothetical protein
MDILRRGSFGECVRNCAEHVHSLHLGAPVEAKGKGCETALCEAPAPRAPPGRWLRALALRSSLVRVAEAEHLLAAFGGPTKPPVALCGLTENFPSAKKRPGKPTAVARRRVINLHMA